MVFGPSLPSLTKEKKTLSEFDPVRQSFLDICMLPGHIQCFSDEL